MGTPLRALIVEDSEDDTLLLVRELQPGGYDVKFERVETAEAMTAALARQTWDVVFCDYTLPHFSGTDALELFKKSGLDIPFIFVSGTIGEDVAVEAMKRGAHDYIIKSNLKRLLPATERELRDAEVRREHKRAEQQVRHNLERIRALHEIGLAITSTLDLRAIAELLLDKINLVLPYRSSTVRLINKETGQLDALASRNLDPEEWAVHLQGTSGGLSKIVLEAMTPVVIENVRTDPRVHDVEFFRKHGLFSYLGIPLIAKDKVLGVLSFLTGEEHQFTNEEVEFLTTLAGQAAIAINNSQLYEQTKNQAVALKKAGESVRESQERFRIIARATNDAVWDWDIVTNWMWWSEGVQELFGYSPKEVSPNPTWWYEHMHSEDRDRVASEIHALIETGKQFWSGEYRYRRTDGSYAYVFSRGHIMHDDKGKPVRMISAMVDITERKRAEEQRQRMARLERYLSPQIAEAMLKMDDKAPFESHRRDITVVFIDLRGFTAFSDSTEPEEVLGLLRSYHAEMGKLIFSFEGTLEGFWGDGIMVLFNDPLQCEDHTERAVHMALKMRARGKELRKRWLKKGYDLDIGIGIATGYATLGNIGFEGRMEYGAVGNVTNVAARLCDQAKGGQILTNQNTFSKIQRLIEVEPMGELYLKGFARPVVAFNIAKLKRNRRKL